VGFIKKFILCAGDIFMNIQVEPILLEQKSVFAQLLNLANYDYTEYTNNDISEDGYFHDDDTDYFLKTDNLHSFFIHVERKLAGFVIIDDCKIDDKNAHTYR